MQSSSDDSDEIRKQIAELLEESKRIRQRSEELALRIADLRARIERDEASGENDSPAA